MSTTSIFAEIFVGGVQATIWLVLLAITFVGFRPQIDDFAKAKDWTALITLAVIALVYAVGVLVDRLADGATGWADRKIESRAYKGIVSVGEARLQIAKASDGLTKHLEYIRSRMRVARVTLFNAVAFTLVVPAFAWRTDLPLLAAAALIGGGLAVVVLATFSWRDTSAMFYTRLTQALQLLTQKSETPSMAEHVIIRTNHGYETALRSAVHRDGRLHFCVHLLAVCNTKLFLQLRSAERQRNANKWTSTVSGHITADDAAVKQELTVDIGSGLAALDHETREELGFPLDVKHRATYVGQVEVLSRSDSEICNSIALVFTINVAELPAIKTTEVREVRGFELSQVSEAISSAIGLPSASGERFGFADNFEPVFRCLLNARSDASIRATGC